MRVNKLKKKIVVIISKLDVAGLNILQFLIKKDSVKPIDFNPPLTWPIGIYDHYKCETFDILLIPEDQIFSDYFENGIQADILIFASKHKSSAEQKALLVHTTGNWNTETGHGGNDFELALAPSQVLGSTYRKLRNFKNERKLNDYWVGFECTHHGPTTVSIPIMFIETGGTDEEWNDPRACKLIADTIIEISKEILDEKVQQLPTLIGLGGNHYCSSFLKIVDRDLYNFGHIAPKYSHDDLPSKLIQEAYHKTLANEKVFVIDKKGSTTENRRRFIEIIESNNWKWDYSQNVKKREN